MDRLRRSGRCPTHGAAQVACPPRRRPAILAPCTTSATGPSSPSPWNTEHAAFAQGYPSPAHPDSHPRTTLRARDAGLRGTGPSPPCPARPAPISPATLHPYRVPMHDAAYKTLFSHPRVVGDLLRGFVPEPWTDALDLDSLEKLPADFASDDLRRQRRADAVWRIRFRGEWLYVAGAARVPVPRGPVHGAAASSSTPDCSTRTCFAAARPGRTGCSRRCCPSCSTTALPPGRPRPTCLG